MVQNRLLLKEKLDELKHSYQGRDRVSPDPVEFTFPAMTLVDLEVRALISALFAYGNVKSIMANLRSLFNLMGHPGDFILGYRDQDFQEKFGSFYYRFQKSDDLRVLFRALHKLYQDYGTMRDFVIKHNDPQEQDLVHVLYALGQTLNLSSAGSYGSRMLFPDPRQSAAKRLHLFLRWMVRSDEVDNGKWAALGQEKLLMPLDTHVFRISKMLGLTNKKSPSLEASKEITAALRKLNPLDPVGYDFSIARLGILKMCPIKITPENCSKCALFNSCIRWHK